MWSAGLRQSIFCLNMFRGAGNPNCARRPFCIQSTGLVEGSPDQQFLRALENFSLF